MKILKETNKTKVLHIKIPKNGTHSINKVLIDKDCWKREYFFGHDPLYVLKKNNSIDENVFIFCVSRNPYTRFFSQYNQLVRTLKEYENKTNIDFCLDIENKNLHPVFVSPQVSWISTEKNNILPIKSSFYNMNNSIYENYNFSGDLEAIKINKIYRLENICDFESDFEVKLSNDNKTDYCNSRYKKFFTEEVINFVKKYYETDFLFFNYDFDFHKSISFRFSYTS